MAPTSKVTAQGQISVPAEIRRQLGIGPGTVLEWEVDGNRAIVRRAKGVTFEDIHKMLFPDGPPKKVLTVEEMDEAIKRHLRKKHARR